MITSENQYIRFPKNELQVRQALASRLKLKFDGILPSTLKNHSDHLYLQQGIKEQKLSVISSQKYRIRQKINNTQNTFHAFTINKREYIITTHTMEKLIILTKIKDKLQLIKSIYFFFTSSDQLQFLLINSHELIINSNHKVVIWGFPGNKVQEINCQNIESIGYIESQNKLILQRKYFSLEESTFEVYIRDNDGIWSRIIDKTFGFPQGEEIGKIESYDSQQNVFTTLSIIEQQQSQNGLIEYISSGYIQKILKKWKISDKYIRFVEQYKHSIGKYKRGYGFSAEYYFDNMEYIWRNSRSNSKQQVEYNQNSTLSYD